MDEDCEVSIGVVIVDEEGSVSDSVGMLEVLLVRRRFASCRFCCRLAAASSSSLNS